MKTTKELLEATDDLSLRSATELFLEKFATKTAYRAFKKALKEAGVDVGREYDPGRAPLPSRKQAMLGLPLDQELSIARAEGLLRETFAQAVGKRAIVLIDRAERPMTMDHIISSLPTGDYDRIPRNPQGRPTLGFKNLIGAALTLAGMEQKTLRVRGTGKTGRSWWPLPYTEGMTLNERIDHYEEMLRQLPSMVAAEKRRLAIESSGKGVQEEKNDNPYSSIL